jgi:L-asparagine transporter-like permease
MYTIYIGRYLLYYDHFIAGLNKHKLIFLNVKETFMGENRKTRAVRLGLCWNIWRIICFILLIVINVCFVYRRISLKTTIILWILFIILFTAGYFAIRKHAEQKQKKDRTEDNKNWPE